MRSLFITILLLVLFTSCEIKSSKVPSKLPQNKINYPSTNAYTAPPIISKENLSITNSQVVDSSYKKSFKSSSNSLQDFWDDAEDLLSDAEDLLNDAEDFGCDDAINAAQDAISNSNDCINTNDYSDAESYLDDAQSDLADAQNYLDDCNTSQANTDDEVSEEENYDDDY